MQLDVWKPATLGCFLLRDAVRLVRMMYIRVPSKKNVNYHQLSVREARGR
jgi:hypothetical protein